VKLDVQQLVDTGWTMKIGQTVDISSAFPLHHTWLVHNHYLFVHDREWNKIVCTDGKESVQHPFSELYNINFGRIGIVKDFAIHPTLPFGVIIEERVSNTYNLIVLRWDLTNPKKKAEQVISLHYDLGYLQSHLGLERMALAYQSFSPDGNWYVVGCIAPDAPQSPHFIAVPVTPIDKEHPDFLDTDNLVILGQIAGMTSIAWTSGPTSYVVSNGELLHKWDLDELPNARVFVMPEDGGAGEKASIFRRIGRLFGKG